MRIALVHDYLCSIGGSERIFQYLCEEFVEADIYTLAYNEKTTLPYFKAKKIHTSWLNRFVRSTRLFKLFFPISTYVMSKLDLSAYDLVLTSSATVAKYVNTGAAKHICYCYIPTRAIWQSGEYFDGGISSLVFKILLPYFKKRDYKAAKKVDKFIAISQVTRRYIDKFYNRDSDLIYCPIDLDKFIPSNNKQDFYLIVSRLESWKKVDYAIEAFNTLGFKLKIVGSGEDAERLKKISSENIEFMGSVDDDQLALEYSNAKAVIFTPYLEYGLIPLESLASGTPVICYGHGGVEETMIPATVDSGPAGKTTAVFYDEQEAESLIDAVNRFEKIEFDEEFLLEHARKWSVPKFKMEIRNYINNLDK